MKKYIIIAMLMISMAITAQSNDEYVYHADEIGFLELTEAGTYKESGVVSELPEGLMYTIIQTAEKIIIATGYEGPLTLKVNSSYMKAQGIREIRTTDINGQAVRVLFNAKYNNIFVFYGEGGIRLHIKTHWNTDVRRFADNKTAVK